MPAVALGFYVMFLVTTLGLRSLVQYRRTGDHGLRRFSGENRSMGVLCSMLLIMGVVLAGAAPIAELLDLSEPPAVVNNLWLRGMGLVPAIVGMAVVIAAQYQMGNSWRIGVEPGETTPLITVGLFGIVRNPIFSGMLLATGGMLTMVPNLISAVAFGSLFVGLQMQVRLIEEPHLVRVHGNQYLSYAGLVGRFLPWIGRLA